MTRPYNFAPGPATLPEEVLVQAAEDMLNWHGCGMSVMEMSHRGAEFISIYEQAEADLRTLLQVPTHFKILFMQGGATAENALVPLNLSHGNITNYVITGVWSKKSYLEARKYCTPHIAASDEAQQFTAIPAPDTWQLHAEATYVHLCSNETVHGVEFHSLPDLSALGSTAPLVIDFSSNVLSRPIDWARVGLAYGGAQKNIGPSGVTIVVVREDLIGQALPSCPTAFDYRVVADNQSMYNTPPTYAIYIAGLVFQWLKRQGGIAAIEQANITKAQWLYDCIDGSDWYINRVAPAARSRMNVPFFLPDEALYAPFLQQARERGLLQLKGHKLVGGLRASIYNAMPLAGVQELVAFMKDFQARYG